MQRESRSVTTSDVKVFLTVAPPVILAELKTIIDQRLTAIVEDDARRTALKFAERNRSSADDMDYEPLPVPDLNDISDSRAQLAAFSDGPIKVEADLRSQFDKQMKIDSLAPEDMPNIKLVFKYSDQYKDGMCAVVDPEVRKKLELHVAKCKLEGLTFPFGYGQSKDLLKIKKFDRAEPGQNLNMTLSFRKWNYEGKSGFSCYAK